MDDDVWRRVHAQHQLTAKMPAQASGNFALTGLLRCPKCGARMRGHTQAQYPQPGHRRPVGASHRTYMCSSRELGATTGGGRCGSVVPAASVEYAVLQTVTELLSAVEQPTIRQRAEAAWKRRQADELAGDDGARRVPGLERQATLTRKRIATASTKFFDGEITRLAYDITSAELTQELEAIDAELGRLRGRVRRTTLPPLDALLSSVAGWGRALREAEPVPLRAALGALLARVEPVRIAYGKYEVRVEWTPIGLALLWAAVESAPTANLVSVDQSAQADCSVRPPAGSPWR